MKIGLFGFGKTGRQIATTILNSKQCILEWVVKKTSKLDHRSAPEFLGIDSEEPGYIYTKDQFEEITSNDKLLVDAIIDFSAKESIFEYADYAIKNNIIIITAISQYDQVQIDYLNEISSKVRILWSPNITIGINFMLIAANVLKKIAPNIDIEIIEEHYRSKPEISGTAKIISNSLSIDESNIKSIRAGGIIGRHELIFGFPFQTVRLIHESISREAFGNGAIFAAEKLKDKPNGLYSMEEIMIPYFNMGQFKSEVQMISC